MFTVAKTVEFYASREGVKPRSTSIAIQTTRPGLFKLSPGDVIVVEVKGFDRCLLKNFYPNEPYSIERSNGVVRLSWFYTKPKFIGNPKFLWGVNFRVEAEDSSLITDFDILEWALAPEETGERDMVDLRLRYRLNTSSPSMAIVGPIPSRKPKASFAFKPGSKGTVVDKIPSRVYGDIQTLISRSPSTENVVDVNAQISVEAWGWEELLVSGRIEVEREDYPIKIYLGRPGKNLSEIPGKVTLIYGLPDLKIVCRPRNSGYPLV